MQNEEEVQHFWTCTETELGEKILKRTLGKLDIAIGGIPSGSYCLLYLTPTRFFIHFFPSEKRFLSLPVGSTSLKPKTICVDRESIGVVDVVVPKKTWLTRAFPPMAKVAIHLRNQLEGVSHIQFTIEAPHEEFLKYLTALKPSRKNF